MKPASLTAERSSDGTQTYVRVDGVIDERFDGKAAANRISSRTTVLNCGGISMITSYGVRAWLTFVKALERRKTDIYYVECSPPFVRELNQVVGFGGEGLVVSCFLPYSCPNCSAHRSVLLRVDQDHRVIEHRLPDEYSCLVCSAEMEFDEEPGLFFPALDAHANKPVSPRVLEFLKARLNYQADANVKLRVLKDVTDAATVISFEGTLDGTLNGANLAHGLEGDVVLDLSDVIHVQQQGLRAWRQFIEHTNPQRTRLWVVGCPVLVVEKALENRHGLQLVSLRAPFFCTSCEQTEFVLVELTSREGRQLREGQLRERSCSACKGVSRPMISADVVQTVSQLPEPTSPRGIQRAAKRAAKRLAKSRVVSSSAAAGQVRRAPRWVLILAAISVVGAMFAVIVGTLVVWRTKAVSDALIESATPLIDQNNAATNAAGTANNSATESKPEWIISEAPNSSYCVDLGAQLRCVGVSSYEQDLDEAEKLGFEAAIEAFVHTALLNSRSEPLEQQRAAYLRHRSAAISELERTSQIKGAHDEMRAAIARINNARGRVAKAALAAGAPGVPTQRSDHYWEEYAADGSKTEFLGFVRVDISNAEVLAFSKHYSETFKSDGLEVSRLNPAFAWVVEDEPLGLYVADVKKTSDLGKAGLKSKDVLKVDAAVLAAADPAESLIKSKQSKPTVWRAPDYKPASLDE